MSSTNTVPSNEQGGPRRLTLAVWGNPLARSNDRTQAGMLLLAFALWLVALPIVAVIGSIAWSGIADNVERHYQGRTVVSARLLADAPAFYFSEHGIPLTRAVPVAARWTAPDGKLVTGTVNVTGGTPAGDQVPIWVDPSGDRTDPLITTTTAAVLTVGATVASWLAWGIALLLMWLAFRRRLDRGRMVEWDRQWAAIEPRWSGR